MFFDKFTQLLPLGYLGLHNNSSGCSQPWPWLCKKLIFVCWGIKTGGHQWVGLSVRETTLIVTQQESSQFKLQVLIINGGTHLWYLQLTYTWCITISEDSGTQTVYYIIALVRDAISYSYQLLKVINIILFIVLE